jgi:hypothetical protein
VSEHWFDLLAAPRTRRQVVGAAVAGVAFTLPFVRAAYGSSSAGCNAQPWKNPTDCRAGCAWTSYVTYEAAVTKCRAAADKIFGAGVASSVVILWNPIPYIVNTQTAELARLLCGNQALIEHKARAYDCQTPDCPGFDPCGPNGPCADCNKVPGAYCCPDPQVLQGYSCCSECCSPDGAGCGSGSTDCGGGK